MKDIGQLFVHLTKFGNDCTILTYLVKNSKLETVDGIKIIKQKSFFKSNNWLISPLNIFHPKFIEYVIENRNNYDCVFSIFNNTLFLPFIFKIFSKKRAAVIKMDSDGKIFRGNFRAIKKIFGTALFKMLCNKIDLFIIETPEAKMQLLYRQPNLKEKLKFIPNGINVDYANQLINNSLKQKNRKKTILIVGDVVYGKGIDLAINSFAEIAPKYPNWTIKIAGAFRDISYKKKLNELIERSGLKRKVVFTGWMKFKDLTKYYVDADIFCFPSRHESFGLAIIEAMFFGKAIVSSDVGVAKYALQMNSGYIFENGNISKLSDILRRLMDDEKLRKEIGMNAKKRCEKLFDYMKIAEKINFYIKNNVIND